MRFNSGPRIAQRPCVARTKWQIQLPQTKQRSPKSALARFAPTYETSVDASGVPSLCLYVLHAFSEIDPDDDIEGAMLLRLELIAKRRQWIRIVNTRATDHV